MLPNIDTRNNNKLYFTAVLAMLLFVGAFCCLSLFFNFPQSDDYWSFFKSNGVNCFQNVWNTYMTWMGNYTWVFLGSIIGRFNLFSFVRWYPLLLVIASICSFLFFFSAFKGIINKSSVILYTLLAQCSWFIVVPYLNENFYWFSASVGYYNTATIIILQMGFVARLFCSNYTNKRFAFAGLLVSTALAGGMSALTVAAQVPVLFVLAVICRYYEDKEHARWLFCAALIAFMGLAIVLICPGAHMRKAVDAVSSGGIATAMSVALHNSPVLLALFFSTPIIYVSLLFMPYFAKSFKVMSCFSNLPVKPRLCYVVLLEILAACGFQFIHGYALGYEMPPRARGLVVWIMFIAWLLFFCCYYRNNRLTQKIASLRIYKWRVVLLCLCFLFNSNFIYLIHDYIIGPAYAKQSNAQYEYVRQEKAKGNLKPILPALSVYPRLLRFHLGIRNPFNAMLFAKYWGIESAREVPSYFLSLERKGISPEDVNLSVDTWAEMGVPKYQYEMGCLYDDIPAYKTNSSKAFRWYLKAAQNGYKAAMIKTAHAYLYGLGVSKSYLQGLKWYVLSKTLPDDKNAGTEFLRQALKLDKREFIRGHTTVYNEKQAFSLYMEAAVQGNKKAQRMLVGLYRRGLGCRKSYLMAIRYFITSHMDFSINSTTELFDDLANDDIVPGYRAALYEGIDFSRENLPLFVRQLSGFTEVRALNFVKPAPAEETANGQFDDNEATNDEMLLGRWSDANSAPDAKIIFKNPLPDVFSLQLHGTAHYLNVGKYMSIDVGDKSIKVKINSSDFYLSVPVRMHGEKADVIRFTPYISVSPAQLWMNNDNRNRLGIGFASLKIYTPKTNTEKLVKGFVFSESKLPDLLNYTEGLSALDTSISPEAGRWSDANIASSVKLHFTAPLPEAFKLYVTAEAFGPNIGRELMINIGKNSYKMLIPKRTFTINLPMANSMKSNIIEFIPPCPAYAKEIQMNTNNFSQPKLGIKFISLRILPEDNPK